MTFGALVLEVCAVDSFSAQMMGDIKINWGKLLDMKTEFFPGWIGLDCVRSSRGPT